MRFVALGHGHYFLWHLPAAVFLTVCLALGTLVARQLYRGEYGARQRALRWGIVGWCAVFASLASGVVWPYLRDAAQMRVMGDGSWQFSNYLGVPVARVPSGELRELRACHLGGLGLGMGHVEVRRANGTVVRTVRLSRATLDRLTQELGYTQTMLSQQYTDTVVRNHRYNFRGPVVQ
jgi:hypothetical protein